MASAAWRSTTTALNGKYIGYGMTRSGWYWIMSNISDTNQAAEYPMSLTIYNNNPMLNVCGTIRSKEWIVETGWCDYVFAPDYKRPDWKDIRDYYKRNYHLPEIDPAEEIENTGLKMAKNIKGILLNVEYNRLDITELYEEINKLKYRITELEKENEKLMETIQKEK